VLDADERQEWSHQAGKIAQMAAIVYRQLKDEGLPDALVERMTYRWWETIVKPTVDFPDLAGIFREIGEDQS